MTQLDLPLTPRVFFTVDCEDEKGNRWRHRVSDPEETIRFIETSLPGVKAKVQKR